METLCSTCSLRNDIEKYRIMLNNLIAEKDYKLLDEEIIKLSEYLDELVYRCVFCNKNLEYISKVNLKNVFGIHSTFYYYGYQHLFTSLYFYITAGINNNELIYVSMGNLLCIYDAYDYMNKGEFINETVIKKSLLTHSYILKNSFLEKIG